MKADLRFTYIHTEEFKPVASSIVTAVELLFPFVTVKLSGVGGIKTSVTVSNSSFISSSLAVNMNDLDLSPGRNCTLAVSNWKSVKCVRL